MTPNLQPHKTLTVYKASAGSGKTFRLAVEYIKLLIENPKAYEGILAVTFTNKATEEMKLRILSQLYGLWKKLPDSRDYLKEVSTALDMNEDVISQRAKDALHLLLHNYHFFRVQTIDTFFQAVLRNLAKELQLNANLKVELNTKEVVDLAVDEIIDSLADDKQLMHTVMNYVEDNMSEDRTWNVITQIKKFGDNIFTELYKQNRRKMDAAFATPDFFDHYKKTLHNITVTTENKYKEYGMVATKAIEDAGLSIDDFSNKTKGPIMYFYKLANGVLDSNSLLTKRLLDAADDPKKWVSSTNKKGESIKAFAASTLMPLISEIEKTRPHEAITYKSAKLTLRHINDVKLLRNIEDTAHTLNDAAQRFMLSDTQSLLHEITEDGDSTFIFEKIGSRLEHIMIDEFQDTSTTQWSNFKPLLHECMSQGNTNLIVGDVKQSIYRFRNGDWRLLNNIDKEFDKTELEFPPINTNWRSDANIINFNNAFFNAIAAIEVDDMRTYSEDKALSVKAAYKDVAQNVPNGRPNTGLVHIEMLPQGMKEEVPERTLKTITDLIDMGIAQRDIAILVRNGNHIPLLAQYIEQESQGTIKMVSEEAFALKASACVRIIINAMTLLAHPKDAVTLASLVTDYYRKVLNDSDTLSNALSTQQDLYSILPKEFTDNMQRLLAMSLHDMAEEIIRIFSINRVVDESAYVTTLFDCMQDFSNDMAPVLEDFINVWNDSLADKTIQSAECNGIRILTIHKSKGLEFKHVICPYCNWNINPPRATTIWVTPKVAPFSELPLVPLDYQTPNSFKETIYEDDGYEEHIQNLVDNLNLLYVAMTRAESSLFIIGERYKEDAKNKKKSSDEKTSVGNRSRNICIALMQLPESINGLPVHLDGVDDDDAVLSLTYGCMPPLKEKKEKVTANVFLPRILPCETNICSSPNNAQFLQSSESRRFANDEMEEGDRQRMIRMGTVLHQLFSTIRTTADIEPALQRMEFDGTLYGEGITRESLVSSLKGKLSDARVSDWFSDRWQVFNECCIISPDGSEHRPDRVICNDTETIVIDFKFGNKSNAHQRQVMEYMTLLKQMGMPNVKGFLWYVTSSTIVNV